MSAPRYIDEVRAGLRRAMAADERVVVLGEDVSYGGPFGATTGLADEFGRLRVRDTPISEAAVMGMAVGAAMSGLRPVVEVMFVDFITLAMDQLVNHAAKLRYMTGGQVSVPLTVRVQGGVNGGFGAQHSQSLEAWFAHTPGLKVVAPAFAGDAAALLERAIADDDPVVYLEHRALYWSVDPALDPAASDGPVRTRRGSDITIVAYSRMVHSALRAAEQLEGDGIGADVIDLKWLVPLDLEAVIASVRATGRLLVAHEAVTQGGIGGEIVARVQAAAFEHLTAPIGRVGAPFTPVGAAPGLEDAFLPGAAEIADAARDLVNGDARA
jgi:acetoin:2,6-dichlorophenolindophenol oxidoreductase subunit beta